MPKENILARDKVLYKGHAIAAVAALTPHAAEEILGLIEVEYEVLPAYTSVEESMVDDALPLHDTWPNNPDLPGSANVAALDQYRFGDPDAGFAKADRVFEREYRTKTVHQGYIEPQNATAWWGPDGRLTVWCSSQGHFGVRDNTARILGLPVSDVKVVPLEIGGGFGGKIPPYLEPVAAVMSKKSGHPVKMVMDRTEVLQATGPTSGSLVRIKIGVTNEGRITAAHCWMALEAGAFPGAPLAGAASAVFAPYLIENVQVDGYDVVSNKPRTQAYRAPGAPIVMYCTETLIDEIAEAPRNRLRRATPAERRSPGRPPRRWRHERTHRRRGGHALGKRAPTLLRPSGTDRRQAPGPRLEHGILPQQRRPRLRRRKRTR